MVAERAFEPGTDDAGGRLAELHTKDKSSAQSMVESGLTPEPPVALIYATYPTQAAALEQGRQLVEARLAGCVNILPGMTAVFIWKGQTETAAEAVLLAKLTPDRVTEAIEFLRAGHPYETPAILVLPVTGGNAAYLDWIRAGCSKKCTP